MAQTNYTPILLYASGTATNVPLAANLTSSASGAELALNYADGKLFYKDNSGTVQVIGWKTTPTTAGGTGLTSFTANGVVYASSTSALTTGSALTFDGASFNVSFANGTNPRIGARFNGSNARIGFGVANSNGFAYLGYNVNDVFNSDNQTYDLSNQPAAQLRMDNGQFRFNIAASGTAGNVITFTQAMTLDASGNLLVGTTTDPSSAKSGVVCGQGINSRAGYGSATTTTNAINLYYNGTNVSLYVDTSNLGAITTVSDYRIKRNIATQTIPALDRVMALRPVTYQMADFKNGLFKAGDDIKEGFIAHEVQEVIPSGVDGVKDDENQIQSLRVDAILSIAVKAIQELSAQVTTLQTQVTALKV